MSSLIEECIDFPIVAWLKCLLNPNMDMAPRPWFFNLASVTTVCLIFIVTIIFFKKNWLKIKENIVAQNLASIGETVSLKDDKDWNDRWKGYPYPSILMTIILIAGTASSLGVIDLENGANILTTGTLFSFFYPPYDEYTQGLAAFK